MDDEPQRREIGYDADGTQAVISLPAHSPAFPVIGFVGVAPAHRGKAYSSSVVARGTAILAENGATEIRGHGDVDNVAMFKGFQRAGYDNFANRMESTRPLGPVPCDVAGPPWSGGRRRRGGLSRRFAASAEVRPDPATDPQRHAPASTCFTEEEIAALLRTESRRRLAVSVPMRRQILLDDDAPGLAILRRMRTASRGPSPERALGWLRTPVGGRKRSLVGQFPYVQRRGRRAFHVHAGRSSTRLVPRTRPVAQAATRSSSNLLNAPRRVGSRCWMVQICPMVRSVEDAMRRRQLIWR